MGGVFIEYRLPLTFNGKKVQLYEDKALTVIQNLKKADIWPNELKLSGIVVGINATQNQKEIFFWNVAVPVHGTC